MSEYIEECENCKKLQEDLNYLKDKYNSLYKKVSDGCYDINKLIDDLASEL